MSQSGSHPMAMYGTLSPGQPNHWVVRNIDGVWGEGSIKGWLFEVTWGDAAGYPGVVLDPNGKTINVSVLQSDRLESHLHEVDKFEGSGYRRVLTEVTLSDGLTIEAWVYEAIQDNAD